MTTTTADMRYGRRGGGWLPKDTSPARPAKAAAPRVDVDPSRRAHPDVIAADRARRHPGTGGDRDAVWAGRARMAAARRAAGQPLDTTDLQALARQETTTT